MKEVILNLAASLDGFIAGPQGEYDWCFTDQDYGMKKFINRVDSTLMGRKTFEISLKYGPPDPHFTHYVFSKTVKQTEYKNVVLLDSDITSSVKVLKAKEGKGIWLFGGAEIISPLMEEGLVDELMISVHPIILGDGIPMFKKGARKPFKLVDSIRYSTGLVQLIYRK